MTRLIKRKTPKQEVEARKRQIFLEERKKIELEQAKKREKEIREKTRQVLEQVQALEETVKMQKFITLVHESPEFRKKMGLYTLKEIEKIRKTPGAYEKAKTEARKNNHAWENDSNFVQKYEATLKAAKKDYPRRAGKLNWESMTKKIIGNNFEAVWRALGLEKLTGVALNPSDFFQIPVLRRVMEHKAKEKWLHRTNNIVILDRYRARLKYWKEQQTELEGKKRRLAG